MSRVRKVKKGDLVQYEGETYRVARRREVTPLAMFRTCDFEVNLVSLDGTPFGFVAENEVERVEEADRP